MIGYAHMQADLPGVMLDVAPDCLRFSLYRFASDNESAPVRDGAQVSPLLEGRSVVVGEPCTLTLNALAAKREWKDYCIWVASGSMHTLSVASVFNRSALTCDSRMEVKDFAAALHISTFMSIFVPHRQALFTEMGISVSGNACPLICNLPFSDMDGEMMMDAVFPRLRMNGPDTVAAGGAVSIQLDCLHPTQDVPYAASLELHLERVNGYLPLNRLTYTGETLEFPVQALGMRRGDTIKIKVGFRHWGAVVEKFVRVV